MRYPEEIKSQAIELYKNIKNTHEVGKQLGIHHWTVYHWVRDIIPEKQQKKNVRREANIRAIKIFKNQGPLTYKETRRFFGEGTKERLVKDGIIKRISRKYGKFTYSVYFIEGQEKMAEEKLGNIIKNLSNFYPIISPNLPKKYTEQEKNIAEFLKISNIPFEHSELLKKINLCPDFSIPNSDKPSIIIEAKKMNTKSRGNYTYTSKIMGFDTLLIKRHYPNCVLIAIINNIWTPSGENRLKQAFDYIIQDNNLTKLLKVCKKHLAG